MMTNVHSAIEEPEEASRNVHRVYKNKMTTNPKSTIGNCRTYIVLDAIITENGSFPSNYSIESANGKKTGKSEDEYNPFEHRHIEHPNSNTRSFANLLKSSLGSGILAMPAAFKNAGTVVGVIGTIILGYICTYCVYMLVKTSQEVCKVVKKPSLGYSETVEEVFASGPARIQPYARFARIFIDWAMAFTILGACSVYVVLLVDSTKQMVDYFHPDINISVGAYCGIFLLPLLVFTQIKNLKYLAPFSALANVLLIATFAICLYYIFQEFPDVSSRKPSTDITKLPLYMGTVIFAMEGIGVVMPVENSMARPENFLGCPGVLNSTMSVVVCLYTIMGFLGYVRYGDDAKGSITLNLPLTDILSLMAKSFIIIAIFFTYTLQFYVPMEIVWRNSKEHITTKYHDLAQIIIRAFFTIITVAIAVAIPKLEQIIGLEGAFFYSFLGLICPAILEIIFCFERFPGKYHWRIWKNIVIVVFGSFVLVTGVMESIKELINK